MNRNELLQRKSSKTNDKTPFIFTTQYNPITKAFPIRKILLDNWNELLKSDQKELFENRPIIGYSRGTNYQGFLGKSGPSN
jgi:hypothetical protein